VTKKKKIEQEDYITGQKALEERAYDLKGENYTVNTIDAFKSLYNKRECELKESKKFITTPAMLDELESHLRERLYDFEQTQTTRLLSTVWNMVKKIGKRTRKSTERRNAELTLKLRKRAAQVCYFRFLDETGQFVTRLWILPNWNKMPD